MPVTIGGTSYMQSTIAEDDPAAVLKPGLADRETAASLTPEELQAAVATIVKFTAEEGIDSTLNGGLETPDQWWDRNKHRIHPDYHDDIYRNLTSEGTFLQRETWQKEYGGKYRYITAADKTRIYNRNIKVTKVWSLSPGNVAVKMELNYEMLATPNVGKTGSGIQPTSGTMAYSATKDGSGKWLIDGYDHEMYTTQG